MQPRNPLNTVSNVYTCTLYWLYNVPIIPYTRNRWLCVWCTKDALQMVSPQLSHNQNLALKGLPEPRSRLERVAAAIHGWEYPLLSSVYPVCGGCSIGKTSSNGDKSSSSYLCAASSWAGEIDATNLGHPPVEKRIGHLRISKETWGTREL